jgi:N-6 DNA Methylase
MASISEAAHTRFSSTCAGSQQAFQRWQSSYLYVSAHPLHEFCLQTAFMQFVHAYCLRLCEEYGLLPPFPTGERESKAWLTSSMQTTLYILNNLDNRSSASIAHCFDWFAPDEQTMLQLYHLLKQHNFANVAGDTLGKVYNESFIEQRNRSENGQFYTPLHIVNYMLDTLEIPMYNENNAINGYDYTKYQTYLNKTVVDLSCGSGSFLVAAAARKRAILQQLFAANEIRQDDALRILTSTIIGFDLNPFACYLSTINLLIQCLPFLFDQHNNMSRKDMNCRNFELFFSPLKFSIYCADALDPLSIEQMGFAQQKFDYMVGNPPYVSANESISNLYYRDKIWNSGHYRLLNQKWDIFVPFFERNLQLLQPESGGLGLIVSSGIETEGYAQRLRQALCQHYSLLQIDFFPGLRVFPRIGIESTMIFLENRPPSERHTVTRRRHLRANLAAFETLPPMRQLAETEQVFRWRYLPALTTSMANESILLCAIAYTGTGIEAQSSEYVEQVIDGRHQKRFTLCDVFVLPSHENERPAGFPDDGVLGDDVDNYHLRRKRYVAYEHYRPYMRGPRHVALFRTPEKLLLGETSGGYHDTSGLFTNHSVQVVVPWHALAQSGALQETGIARVWRKSQQISGISELAQISQQFDLRYILAIINSRFIRCYLAANMHQGTRKGRIYPDIWKQLPIKIVSLERQNEIALLVEAVQNELKNLARQDELKNKDELMKVNELVDVIERLVEAIYGKPPSQA